MWDCVRWVSNECDLKSTTGGNATGLLDRDICSFCRLRESKRIFLYFSTKSDIPNTFGMRIQSLPCSL
jgi:hypothetical protein